MSVVMQRWLLTAGLLLLCTGWAAWADETPQRVKIVAGQGEVGPGGSRVFQTPPHDWATGNDWTFYQTRKLYGLSDEQNEKLTAFLTERLRSSAAQQTRMAYGQLATSAELLRKAGVGFNENELTAKLSDLRKQLVDFREENRRYLRDEVLTADQQKEFDELVAASNDPLTGTPADEFLANHKPEVYAAWKAEQQRQQEAQRNALMSEYRAQAMFTGRGFVEQEWEGWLNWVGSQAKLSDEQKAKAGDFLRQAKEAAAEYRKAKEADYKKIVGDLAKLNQAQWNGKPFDAEKHRQLQSTAIELAAPVEEIGKRLREDVVGLLSESQRKALPASVTKGPSGWGR